MIKTKKRSPLTRLLSAVTALASAAFVLPAMPQLSAAAAEYNLTIAGTTVTSSNASDILGDGVFSYDAFGKVLTVSGNCTSNTNNIINSQIDNLTINVASDSILENKGELTCVWLGEGTTITGNGTLTAISASATGIYSKDYLKILDTAIIADGGIGGIRGHDYDDVYNYLYVSNSDITATGTSGAIYDFNAINLNDCEITAPQGALNYNGRIYESMTSSTFAKAVQITRTVPVPPDPVYESYDLYIAGTQVTEQNASDILGNSVFSYDAGTKTLTIDGYYTQPNTLLEDTIESHINGLKINVASDSVLKNMAHSDWDHSTCLMYLFENTTITGSGKLTGITYSTSIYVEGGKKLTLDNANLDITSTFYPIRANYDTNNSLLLKNSTVHLNSSDHDYVIDGFKGGVTFTDCYINYQGGYVFQNGTVELMECYIQPTTYYDLYVCGTQVSSANANKILGDYNFAYNANTKTLYVRGDKQYSGTSGVILNKINGLTISISNDAVLQNTYSNYPAIIIQANTKITGNGKLTAKSSGGTAISVLKGKLTFEDANVLASGYNGIYGSSSDTRSLSFVRSQVEASSSSTAIGGMNGGITLTDCIIKTPAGGSISSGTVVNSTGAAAKSAKIGLESLGLTISGEEVNAQNASDVLGNGKFSYNADTKTLTIKGVSDSTSSSIVSEVEGLTINVASNSNLYNFTPNQPCILLKGNTTITGSGKLTARVRYDESTTQSDSTVAAIYAYKKLTIKNADVSATGSVGIGGQNANASLEIDNSVVTATNFEGAHFGAVNSFGGGITFTGCGVETPGIYKIQSGRIYKTVSGVTSPAETVIVKKAADLVYGLKIAGTLVTGLNASDILGNGVFSYDPEVRKLTVNGSYSFNGNTSANILVNSELEGNLTIYIASDSVLEAKSDVFYTEDTNLTVTGPGKLTLRSTNGYQFYMNGATTLTIKDMDLSGYGGITGDNGGEKLILINSRLHVEDDYAAIWDFGKGIVLQDCFIANPANAKINSDGDICNADGSCAKTVDIEKIVNYNLKIAGTEVTNANAADVFSDGRFSYNPDTRVLTIKGVYSTTNRLIVIENHVDGLTINVASNTVLSAGGIGIYSKKRNLTITGPGKLTINASDSNSCAIDIEGGTLTIKDANLEVKGHYGITGDYAKENLIIDHSTIHAEGINAAINDFESGITLKNCYISAPATAVITEDAIYDEAADMNAKSVDILPVTITKQPVNRTVALGGTAKFSVTAEAESLSYQWQNYTSSGWKDSGLATAKTAELSVPVTAARDGYKYRCVINGTTISNAVTLKVKPAIKKQPANYTGAIGTTAKFTVEAEGAGTLSYQWQNYTSSGWKDSGLATAKTAELSVPVTAARDGYKYRCVITSTNGTKATSNTAVLKVQTAIKTQPKNVTDVIGTTAKFTVAATGAGTLSYQWQCDTGSGNGFKNSTASGAKTATLSIPVTAARDGYKYRCIVTSTNGTTKTSSTAALKVKTVVIEQPVNAKLAIGSTAKFAVTASGAGTLSYQWQNYTSSGWKDSGLATAKTAELSVPVTAARDGYKYRCVVTSSNGSKDTSATAVLTVQTAITKQPVSVTQAVGTTA